MPFYGLVKNVTAAQHTLILFERATKSEMEPREKFFYAANGFAHMV
jgi:hypothetical protein